MGRVIISYFGFWLFYKDEAAVVVILDSIDLHALSSKIVKGKTTTGFLNSDNVNRFGVRENIFF